MSDNDAGSSELAYWQCTQGGSSGLPVRGMEHLGIPRVPDCGANGGLGSYRLGRYPNLKIL